jgi:hypothetical protein
LGLIAISAALYASDDDYAGLSRQLSVLAVIVGLFIARAYWIVARAVGDPLRPVRATRIAGVAGVLLAISGILTSFVSALVNVANRMSELTPDVVPGALITTVNLGAWLGNVIAPMLLVWAMATGVIDPDAPADLESPATLAG